jgi:hypothetical protein
MRCFAQTQGASQERTSRNDSRRPASQIQSGAASSLSAGPGRSPAGFSHSFGHVSAHPAPTSDAQPALTLGLPGDVYEQEAERISSQVTHGLEPRPDARPAISRIPAHPVQRMCAHCEEEEKKEGKGGARGAEIEGHTAAGIHALCGQGAPLPPSERSFFEPRFGHDFSRVRIHTGNRAAGLASTLQARAFTVGQDIVFGEGEYDPGSPAGKQVLAHELTHTVQQGAAADRIQRLKITQHALAKGTCDDRNVQWVFSLGKQAPADGYIVQHIQRGEFVSECPNIQAGPPDIKEDFFEAWKLKKNETVDWTTTRDGWTDGSTHPPRPNTGGVYFANGEVKFFLQSTTGDLGDFGVASSDPASAWGPGRVATSGALPSTASQPSWWSGAPAEGPAKRSIWSTWNCCDADPKKNSYDLKVTP